MDEASRCDRIALCNEGRILGIDTPNDIVAGFKSLLYNIKADNMFQLLQDARKVKGVEKCYPFGDAHHLVANNSFDIEQFKQELANTKGLKIEPVSPSIEDMFIKLMEQ